MNVMVVSFSHTNYCIRSAGTEKFIRNLSECLQENSVNHLHFFSFYHDVEIPFSKKQKKVGVNYNDKFIGIYNYSDILDIIKCIEYRENQNTIAVHIEHILNHDLSILAHVISVLAVPVYYFIHDYYCVCKNLKLIDSEGKFCGVSSPNEMKCANCQYGRDGINHYNKISKFFDSISPHLKYFIAPSRYVERQIKVAFPKFKERVVVREHLQTSGKKVYTPIGDKIRIAFVGGPFKEKGFAQWKKLVCDLNCAASGKYSFFYLGSAKEEISGVKSVYVSTAEQGDDAMIRAIADNNIECAFVWPLWAETYSYVYYELAVNGVFILTNTISGNIYEEVETKQNGKVFENYENCLRWLVDSSTVRHSVDIYRLEGSYRPSETFINSDLSLLIESDAENFHYAEGKTHIKKDITQTLTYEYKYRKLLS